MLDWRSLGPSPPMIAINRKAEGHGSSHDHGPSPTSDDRNRAPTEMRFRPTFAGPLIA